jgi:hypothetical protein
VTNQREPNQYRITVDLPVPAQLALVSDDGREVPITPELLKRLGLVKRDEVFKRFRSQLVRALGIEYLEDAPGPIQTIRSMVDHALDYDFDFDYSANPDDPEDEDTREARALVSALRQFVLDGEASVAAFKELRDILTSQPGAKLKETDEGPVAKAIVVLDRHLDLPGVE